MSAERDILLKAEDSFHRGEWQEVLHIIPSGTVSPPDLLYYRGMALFRLGDIQQAKLAFELGTTLYPKDKKFHQELAGVYFKLGNYRLAKSTMLKALRLDPADKYSRDFLASLFLRERNVEAAVKFWNPDKPFVENIQIEPPPRLNAIVSDRAFVCAPYSILGLEVFRSTEARLKQLDLYPRPSFQLVPRTDGNFDLVFRSDERNGLGDNALEKAFSILREVPGLSLHFDFYNLSGAGRNWQSWFRFDSEKLKLLTQYSAPLFSNPAWRINFYLEGRHENWDLSKSYPAETSPSGDLILQRLSAGVRISNIPGWRWAWKTGIEYSYRTFTNPPEVPPNSQELYLPGGVLKYQVSFESTLLRQPERHLRISSQAIVDLGNFFAVADGKFLTAQGGLRAEWQPGLIGENWTLYAQFRAGETVGEIPFDELFVLGLERDNDLWLRGLIATSGRKPGSGLLGRSYLLLNLGCERRIYHNPLFNISMGPFVDSGQSYDSNGVFGAASWHWDAGIVLKARIFTGLTVDLSFGRDFQSSRNGFYVTPSN